jgi:cytidylate kinase
MKRRLVITIDGPAGVGKSTVGMLLADKISYAYLNTGALYRAFAFEVMKREISCDDEKSISKLCGDIKISIKITSEGMKILIDKQDITRKINTEEMGFLASRVSTLPFVRRFLLPVQQDAGKNGGIVAEGRDMGTVVFPGADIKFFLDADIGERTRRRYLQLLEKNIRQDFEEIKTGIEKRDRQDTERSISPLKPSKDAITIDTTRMGIEEVVGEMSKIYLRTSVIKK